MLQFRKIMVNFEVALNLVLSYVKFFVIRIVVVGRNHWIVLLVFLRNMHVLREKMEAISIDILAEELRRLYCSMSRRWQN